MDKDIIIAIKEELAEVSLDLNLIESESYKKISKHAKNTEGILYDLLEKDGYISNEKILVALENKYSITLAKEAESIEANYKNFPYKFCEKNGLTYKLRTTPILSDDEITSLYLNGDLIWIDRYKIKYENRINNKTKI